METLVIARDYHAPGVSSLTGRFPFKEFSNTDHDNYRAGRTVWSANTQTDARDWASVRHIVRPTPQPLSACRWSSGENW